MSEAIVFAVRRFPRENDRARVEVNHGDIVSTHPSATKAEEARLRLRKQTPDEVELDVIAIFEDKRNWLPREYQGEILRVFMGQAA